MSFSYDVLSLVWNILGFKHYWVSQIFLAFLDRSSSRMKFAFKSKKSIAHRPKKNNSIGDERSQKAFKLYLYYLCYVYFKKNSDFTVHDMCVTTELSS